MLVDMYKSGKFRTPSGRQVRFLMAYKLASETDILALGPDPDELQRMPPGLAGAIYSKRVETVMTRRRSRVSSDIAQPSFHQMAVIATTEDGTILYANNWAEELSFFTTKELLGTLNGVYPSFAFLGSSFVARRQYRRHLARKIPKSASRDDSKIP